MILFFLIFSFFIEASISSIIKMDSLFIPLSLITSLVILYPYFKNKKLNFFIVSLICGLFYDIAFADSTFINVLSFGVIGGLIILGYNYVSYSIYSSNLLNIGIIILYRIISYLLLFIIDYINFDFKYLLKIIYSSLISNIIYGIILFIVVEFTAKKLNIKRVE